ncbi:MULTISPECIES: sec-independent translocase [unclassified Streptomyces]|uniref:sec-independent translocase n=1 Tax=unclassified Streptomyces TaxID=2593676 RepID=UPI001587349A|nr:MULTISPECIES: sec-independent translocase [unclassified Streptomyces]NUV66308.1 Sec-independent protein translocase subunit TatB [Streptomyces sp. CAI-121]NUW03126.1 Sec-independent protein translocase subunit TatB [Streptomyces sp. CAI 127]NUW12010.1 Sec-independent protein translocase subunit TatB [Streptomyces sp. CAI-68]
MFNDIGALELLTLGVLAVLVFGPDKLPKLIQDVTRTIRKIREFSDSAKEDIRSELGPQFKDFEFEDLNPKTFVRKQLMDGNDDLGLKEIRESFDLRKDLADVTDAVNGRTPAAPDTANSAANGSAGASAGAPSTSLTKTGDTAPDLLKKAPAPDRPERPPFDSDAT